MNNEDNIKLIERLERLIKRQNDIRNHAKEIISCFEKKYVVKGD